MEAKKLCGVKLRAVAEQWPLATPFTITGRTWHFTDVVVVTLARDGREGRGEASGVYYLDEDAVSILKQVDGVRPTVEMGISRASLQLLLPPGGARNAIDCALWDLETKLTGNNAAQLANITKPRPLLTTFTCPADTPEKMAATARRYHAAKAIKLKLTGDSTDADRVRAVRDVCKDVWLGVDANQGFSRDSLKHLMPTLVGSAVSLIEQPFPRGQEALLDDFKSPIPIAADESVQSILDLPGLVGRFDAINIKLDKAGGVTEALAMARAAQELNLRVMVGSMISTSLAIAPAILVGQSAFIVDLDSPVFLTKDRDARVNYSDGLISCPSSLWGGLSTA